MKIVHAIVSKNGVYGGGENIVSLFNKKNTNYKAQFITNNPKLYNIIEGEKYEIFNIKNLNFIDLFRFCYRMILIFKFHERYLVISHHRFLTLGFYFLSFLYNIKVIHYVHYFSSNFKILSRLNIDFIAVSNSLYNYYLNFYNIKPDRISVIYNGSPIILPNLNRIQEFKSHFLVNNNIITIGILGRLTELKNHKLLIDSFHDIILDNYKLRKKLKLFIIGDGELESELKEIVNSNNLTNVCFTGFIDSPVEICSVFNILVQPSISEGLPFTIIENLYSGAVFVASNIDPIKEVLGQDYPFLFISKDKYDLSCKLLSAIKIFDDQDYDSINRIRKYQIDRYDRFFDTELMYNKFDKYINKFI